MSKSEVKIINNIRTIKNTQHPIRSPAVERKERQLWELNKY